MKVTITAGTHIGIVGCYGEKTINIKGDNPEQEIKDFILNEFKDEITRCDYKWRKEWDTKKQTYSFVDPEGFTLLEYHYTRWV
jgi:hypothetical protein